MVENNISLYLNNNIAIVEFAPGHIYNPFSSKRIKLLNDVIDQVSKNDKVEAVILYGGKNNSFCSGGDLKEMAGFSFLAPA